MSKRDVPLETKADRLLSGGRGPSMSEKDEILKRVLDGLPPPSPASESPRRRRWGWLSVTSLLGGAAAAAAMLVVVFSGPGADPTDPLVPRGAGDGVVPVTIDVGCGERTLRAGAEWNERPLACAATQPVALRVARARPGWAVAAAVHLEDGTLIWVLPDADTASAAGPVGTQDLTFSLAGASAPGARLLATFSESDLSRDEARRRFAAHLESDPANTAVVEVRLRIETAIVDGGSKGPTP